MAAKKGVVAGRMSRWMKRQRGRSRLTDGARHSTKKNTTTKIHPYVFDRSGRVSNITTASFFKEMPLKVRHLVTVDDRSRPKNHKEADGVVGKRKRTKRREKERDEWAIKVQRRTDEKRRKKEDGHGEIRSKVMNSARKKHQNGKKKRVKKRRRYEKKKRREKRRRRRRRKQGDEERNAHRRCKNGTATRKKENE